MHSDLNIWSILLLGACFLAPMNAQTTKPASGNTVTFREPKRLESAPQPPPALRQVTAGLSGTVAGHFPSVSIEFALTLQNNGPQGVKILDPLDSLRLQFTTMGNKLIPMPERVPKGLPKVGLPRNAIPRTQRDAPYPAPIQFRQILTATEVNSQKEETITIPPGAKVQILCESEPVVMERVMQALRTETGEAAKSFKARATMGLLSAPPQPGVGGQLLDSDWIFFTIPSS
jgi:hypothetical protein